MALVTSGSVKIPGLGNGTDFQDMLDKLEQIEMKHAIQLDKWKQDWKKRLEAFEQVRAAMVEYSSVLKEMNNIDKFMVKNVLNSNSGVCNVTASGSADNTSHTLEVKQKATNSYASIVLNLDNKLDSVNSTGLEQKLKFQLGNATPPEYAEVTVPPNCTLEGLKNIINQEFGSPKGDALGMRASIIGMGNGKQMLQIYSTSTGAHTGIELVGGDEFWDSAAGGGNMGIKDTDGLAAWKNNAGQDAMVRIDGWPSADLGNPNDPDTWLHLSTNTLNHIPGLSITVTGAGTTVLDISLDTESIKENIQKFVDSTNELRTMMKELTDYNASAQTIGSDYADSQFDTQKGGVLMGNYGMQLMMSKMKTFIFSKPEGFEYLVKDDATGQVISGDIFSSLAHIGIKTDDEQGSPTYGLLVFENNVRVATGSGVEMITFEDALEMHAQGIAELFAADRAPSVDGYNFGFVSDVAGVTQAGSYEVSYEVDAAGNIIQQLDADGNIISTSAYVNGQQAKWNPATNQLTVVGEGPAKGILLDIYNNKETNGTPHTGTIRLKSGFLPGLINMVDGDFLDPDSGEKDTKKGTLSILISQYTKIISNINEKIAKEDERLILWRQRMDLRFARMEATLKTYSGLQAQLEAQINSLSSTKKS